VHKGFNPTAMREHSRVSRWAGARSFVAWTQAHDNVALLVARKHQNSWEISQAMQAVVSTEPLVESGWGSVVPPRNETVTGSPAEANQSVMPIATRSACAGSASSSSEIELDGRHDRAFGFEARAAVRRP
jgi:hypothetical protein